MTKMERPHFIIYCLNVDAWKNKTILSKRNILWSVSKRIIFYNRPLVIITGLTSGICCANTISVRLDARRKNSSFLLPLLILS